MNIKIAMPENKLDLPSVRLLAHVPLRYVLVNVYKQGNKTECRNFGLLFAYFLVR
jgi:hypothetical protein